MGDRDFGRRPQKSANELQPLAPKIEVVGSGEDWFELRYSLGDAGWATFSAAELQRLLRSGQSQTRLRNGRTAVFRCGGDHRLRGSAARCRSASRCSPAPIGSNARTPATSRRRRRRSPGSAPDSSRRDAKPPAWLSANDLRDYQREGVSWLWRLAQNQPRRNPRRRDGSW